MILYPFSDDNLLETSLDRRDALKQLTVSSALITSPLWLPPSYAAARDRSRVVNVSRGKTGTTLKLELAKGPYPCRGGKWKDPTTYVFVPHHFRAMGDRIDTVLHFHGHGSEAFDSMKRHQLREQLVDSRQNAILVVPQGPIRAKSSSFGKLDSNRGLINFLTDLRATLQRRKARRALKKARIGRSTRIGVLCLSAHSGGYRAAARCATVGGYNVNEIYLFDSLYGEVAAFRDWIAARRRTNKSRKRHKLISYYAGGKVATENKKLMASLEKLNISYLHDVEGKRAGTLTRKQLTRARAVFIRSRLSHGGVTHDLNNLRDCLFASCLKRRLNSNWFKNKNKARTLEPR